MPWFDTGYSFKKSITIDDVQVIGSSDHSNFPVLITFTDADLKTTGNGGHVQNANGYDIIFTNAAEDTQLDHEIEKYVASTGEIEMHVRVPTLATASDTVIYMYFGNSSISTSQENATGVWDSNYKLVYHMKETAGTSNSIKDSTSNANHGTPYTTYSTTVGNIATSSGKIDGAQSFNGSSRAIEAPNSSSLNINGQNTITISAWIKRTASNSVGSIIVKGTPGVGGYMLGVGESPASTNQFKLTKYGIADIAAGTMPADTNWHYVVEVGHSGGTSIYVDGSLSATDSNNSNFNSSTATFNIGNQDQAYWDGLIDEVRISNTNRSADWIATEYNNQNDPATFYSVGSLQTQSETKTRTIPATIALLTTNTRTIPSTAALLTTNTRTIPATAALQQTNTRTIPSTIALQTTNARTIPSDIALLQTNTREIPATIALAQTRIIPCTIALQTTLRRTIPCTIALLGDTSLEPNAAAYVRSGDALVHVRSGNAVVYVRD